MMLSVALDAPPIRVEPDGTARVGDTGVTLDVFLEAYRSGETPEEIADSFGTLGLADVYATIAYYLRHKDEVDAYLEERERQAEKLREIFEKRLRGRSSTCPSDCWPP